MSIFGVKKKQVDISKIKKKVKDMDNLYKYNFFEMYENFNNLNFKILEIENSLKKIKDKPDRKIMSIVAKVERIGSQVVPGQKFIFRESGLDKYLMNFSGQIVGISFLTEAKVKPTVNINITIDDDGSEQNLPIRGLLNFGNSFSLGPVRVPGVNEKNRPAAALSLS